MPERRSGAGRRAGEEKKSDSPPANRRVGETERRKDTFTGEKWKYGAHDKRQSPGRAGSGRRSTDTRPEIEPNRRHPLHKVIGGGKKTA